jgi:hypothetical protein
MIENKIFDIKQVGKVVNEYYVDREGLLKRIRKKKQK